VNPALTWFHESAPAPTRIEMKTIPAVLVLALLLALPGLAHGEHEGKVQGGIRDNVLSRNSVNVLLHILSKILRIFPLLFFAQIRLIHPVEVFQGELAVNAEEPFFEIDCCINPHLAELGLHLEMV